MKKYLLLPMLFGLFMLIAQPALAFCGCCPQVSSSPCITGCAVPVQPAPQLVYQPKIISQPAVTCCPKLSYCPKTVLEPVITYQSRTVMQPVTTYETRTFCTNRVVYEPHLVCPQVCAPTHIMGAAAPIQPICCPARRSLWDRIF
jgi:hypothetical protein